MCLHVLCLHQSHLLGKHTGTALKICLQVDLNESSWASVLSASAFLSTAVDFGLHPSNQKREFSQNPVPLQNCTTFVVARWFFFYVSNHFPFLNVTPCVITFTETALFSGAGEQRREPERQGPAWQHTGAYGVESRQQLHAQHSSA